MDVAKDGTEGLDLAESGLYSAVILDVMVPGLDGLAVARRLRQDGISVPVLMLTAKNALSDRQLGFDSGADDYLTKPFAFQELLAQLRAITRRGELPIADERLIVDDVVMDTRAHEVTRGGNVIDLRRTGLRLATQTVALLLVMLIVLEAVVYVITQHALLQTLESTLRNRAHPSQAFVHSVFQPRREPAPGHRHGHQFRDTRHSEASVVYLDLHLNPVGHGSGNLGGTVLDPTAAQQSLRVLGTQCCSEHLYGGTSYLVYTDVLRDREKVVGLAQSSIPVDQYHSTLASLQQALVAVARRLGLAIAKWIVGVHGGNIHAGNMPSGGAVFTVILPLLHRDGRPLLPATVSRSPLDSPVGDKPKPSAGLR